MADAQLKLSRRTLLAAACAAPAFPLAATPAVRSERSRGPLPSEAEALSSLTSAWNRALSRFQRADAAVTALEGTPDDDAFNRAADALDRALESLLRAPAPHLSALAAKLEFAIDHQAWELRAGEVCMTALASDARRLS